MVASSPEAAGGRIVDATRSFSAGDRAAAEQAYREVAAANPKHPLTWSNLAALALALEDVAGAGNHARHALSIDSGCVEAMNNLAMAHWGNGQEKAAVATLKQAIRARPGRETPWLNLALILHGFGQVRDALVLLDKSNAHTPKSWKIALRQAELARASGDAQGARAHVLRALANLLPTLDLNAPAKQPAALAKTDDAQVRQALFASVDALEAGGRHDWYLIGATLLSIYRDGRLFPHDKDVDLAILDAPDFGALRRLFEGRGDFALPNYDADATFPVLGLIHKPTGVGIDIFLPRSVDGAIQFEMGWPDRLVARNRMHGIERLQWAGRDWGVPSPPERYLEDCYGTEWRSQWRQVGDSGYDMRYSDTQVTNPSRTAESLPRAVTLGMLRLVHVLQSAHWPKAHALCLQLLGRERIPEVQAILNALDTAGHAPHGH